MPTQKNIPVAAASSEATPPPPVPRVSHTIQFAAPEEVAVSVFEPVLVPLERLVESPWNANRVPDKLLTKLRRSLCEFGVVENLIARPHPSEPERLEVIGGNHRLRLYQELALEETPVVVVKLDDAQARLLAQTLNRTRGSDDPKTYAALLERVLQQFAPARVSEFLPETESSLHRHLRSYGSERVEPEPLLPPAQPRSKLGEVYQLGPHRLLCGDATDPVQVAELLTGVRVDLMVTDPPYGVGVDHSWRDGVRQPAGSGRGATLLNDDRADWREGYALSRARVAYVWHGALYAGLVQEGLEEAGFEVRQQIIWVKQVHALSRAHYQWKHEPCWYAVRKGANASWKGDRKEFTVWEEASPIAAFGSSGEQATAHPTQKPLALYTRPLLNHTEPGGVLYDPFAGSGTALIAAEQHARRCLAIELDPAWCDVIRDRYQALKGTS